MVESNKDGNTEGTEGAEGNEGKENNANANIEGSGSGTEKKPEGNGSAQGALTKEDIQTIVKESIAAAVKDVITPELDRRISGATKTIYKKVGVKEEGDTTKKQPEDAGAIAESQRLESRREMVTVYAEASLKEELGKLDPEVQKVVDKILPLEVSGIEFEEGITNRDHGAKVAKAVAEIVKNMRNKIETAKVEALKKAGQIIDIGTSGGNEKPENDFDSGKKLAEKRHPKKK